MERRRIFTLAALGTAITLAVGIAGTTPKTASANVRVPSDPNEVLEEVLTGTSVTATGSALAGGEVRVAVRLAHINIQLARETSDPRYLGHAQAALAPWWSPDRQDEAGVPAPVLVLRATIEQSLHDFDAALRHLDLALALEPEDMQAWLTRATILTVLGRYEEAQRSCAHLPAQSVPRMVCETQIESLTGHAKEAHDKLLTADGVVSGDQRAWVLSVMGEYAMRSGDTPLAEKHLRDAIAIAPKDAYTRDALADLLIDEARYSEATALLAGHENDDGMLLRLAIAERRNKSDAVATHIKMLEDRFDASRARGDVVHRREEARFWLDLKDEPTKALDLARANWDVQKEPWDARILLAAANAAKSIHAAAPVIAFLDQHKLEDPAIARLRRQQP